MSQHAQSECNKPRKREAGLAYVGASAFLVSTGAAFVWMRNFAFLETRLTRVVRLCNVSVPSVREPTEARAQDMRAGGRANTRAGGRNIPLGSIHAGANICGCPCSCSVHFV